MPLITVYQAFKLGWAFRHFPLVKFFLFSWLPHQSEDQVMRETLEQAKRRVAEFEERQRQWREEQQRKDSEASSHQRIDYR